MHPFTSEHKDTTQITFGSDCITVNAGLHESTVTNCDLLLQSAVGECGLLVLLAFCCFCFYCVCKISHFPSVKLVIHRDSLVKSVTILCTNSCCLMLAEKKHTLDMKQWTEWIFLSLGESRDAAGSSQIIHFSCCRDFLLFCTRLKECVHKC